MPQTSYNVDSAVGVPGMVMGIGPRDIETCIANETIPPGRVVCRDATTGLLFLPKADADLAFAYGVSVFDDMRETKQDGTSYYVQYSVVPVLRSGKIYMEFNGGTAAFGKAANVKDAAGTVAQQGMATATAVSADAIGAVGGLRFCGAAATTALALVEVHMPNNL